MCRVRIATRLEEPKVLVIVDTVCCGGVIKQIYGNTVRCHTIEGSCRRQIGHVNGGGICAKFGCNTIGLCKPLTCCTVVLDCLNKAAFRICQISLVKAVTVHCIGLFANINPNIVLDLGCGGCGTHAVNECDLCYICLINQCNCGSCVFCNNPCIRAIQFIAPTFVGCVFDIGDIGSIRIVCQICSFEAEIFILRSVCFNISCNAICIRRNCSICGCFVLNATNRECDGLAFKFIYKINCLIGVSTSQIIPIISTC